ncbi:MAG TPA: HAD hydrolase-like protein [Herpetosiphonaceae bacterium]
MKYQLVIFDFDGTLANSFPWFVSTFNTIADKYKFKRVEAGELDTLRGYSARQMIQHLGVPAWKLPFIGRHAKRLMGQNVAQIVLFDGVDGMLHELARRGVTLAVVSSNSEANIRRVLGPQNAALVTYYECGAALFGKHVQFRKILKKSRIPRSQTLCIGDEIRDIEAARRVALPFGAVAWGFTNVEALKAYAPEEIFSRVEEIVEKVV